MPRTGAIGRMLPAVVAERPAPAAPGEYRFPPFERVRLANGLEVIVATVRKLPVITVMLVADAGAGTEPVGQDGVAILTTRAMLEGTTRRTGNELTDQFERLGAAIAANADWDAATLTMTTLTSHLPRALELFAEVVLDPSFPERDVERLRAERLSELLQLRTEPRGLADDMFAYFLYQPGSRYALPEHGGAVSVRARTRADLEAFARARIRPDGSSLLIVGDLSMAEALDRAERLFGTWEGRAALEPPLDDAPASHARTVRVVAKADAPQSEIRIGHVGLPRRTPDYFPTLLMNAVLGGLFSSRINLNLREQHGYTYGAFSGFEWRKCAGPFVVSAAVRSDVTDASIREVLSEINRIRADTIDTDELTLATSYLDGVFPIKYETTEAIARALAAMVVYGLPDDYFDRYRQHIRAVTLTDVLHAADAHLHPEMLQCVVVGDPAVVRAPLEALELGPLTVHDPDGKLVSG